jgi:hypothetical protein
MKYFCKNCKKIISYNPERQGKGYCNSCGNQKPETWKFCIDCGRRIRKHNKRCKPCFYKWYRGKNVVTYKHGKVGNARCIDCHTILKNCYSKRCASCWKKRAVGKHAPNYIDGGSTQHYPTHFTTKLKEKIRASNNYLCQVCEMTEEEHITVYGQVLSVHHIDHNKKNCAENNLTVLCIGCNNRVNYNREHWILHFQHRQKIKLKSLIT